MSRGASTSMRAHEAEYSSSLSIYFLVSVCAYVCVCVCFGRSEGVGRRRSMSMVVAEKQNYINLSA